MSTLSLIGGALWFQNKVFATLRERSDVFYRGFLVLLFVGLASGAFASAAGLVTRVLRPPNETQVTQQALDQFDQSNNVPPQLRSTIESYMTEGVAMGFELGRLPPNAGAEYLPFARFVSWLGETIAIPFGSSFLGLLLLGGLLVHLGSRWLGGHAGIAQMLGVSALAFAPHVLDPLASLFTLAANLGGSAAFGQVASLIGLLVSAWGAVIYVKATAVAQGFSYGRAIGAILIALALAAVLSVVIAVIVGALVAGGIAALVAATR